MTLVRDTVWSGSLPEYRRNILAPSDSRMQPMSDAPCLAYCAVLTVEEVISSECCQYTGAGRGTWKVQCRVLCELTGQERETEGQQLKEIA
jgi:hypothetical protein